MNVPESNCLSLRSDVLSAWLPPHRVLAEEWIPVNVQTPPGSEYEGFFSFDVAPHTRGVLRAWDDPDVREIYLCWATRNMKTSTMISLMMCAAVNVPRPMAFGSCDEASIDRTIDEQIYPMLDACEATRRLIPTATVRGRRVIKFNRCRVRKAYGGSHSSVAGYPAWAVFGSEWDKWPARASTEAQAANSLLQRTKGYPFTSKVVLESTPSTKDNSRIWSVLFASQTDRRDYYVPCPQCGRFQTLKFDQIRFDAGQESKPDISRAAETAVYICEHCSAEMQDEDRAQMMRAGLWVSDGQRVDKRGRIYGRPKVESPYIGFGPLSSLYSLLVGGWGQIVADYLKCGDDPDKLRDFENGTLALPWDPTPIVVEPHELGKLMCSSDTQRICPAWAIFLTLTIDVQPKDAGWEFPWQVAAWGIGGRGATIDYGTADGWEEVATVITAAQYDHIDGGRPLRPVWVGIDSGDGNSQEDVYAFCRQRKRCLPLKGASHSMTAAFLLSELSVRKKRTPAAAAAKRRRETNKLHRLYKGESFLVLVNTDRSQKWIQRIIEGRAERNGDGWFSFPAEAAAHGAFLNEFLNEVQTVGYDSKGYEVTRWERRDRHQPNDQRDLARYNWALAMIATNHGSEWWTLSKRSASPPRPKSKRKSKRRRRRTVPLMGGWQPSR